MDKLCHMTDDELVVLYADGCDEAFDLLLSRHQSSLFNYISYALRNTAVSADDVFQETFVKVIVSLREGRYTPNGHFGAWLTRIAHNIIADLHRDEQLCPTLLCDDAETDLLDKNVQADASREAEIINEQTLAEVRSLMDLLPDVQREVVYLRFYENRSFREISDITQSPLNTCLGRFRYGVQNMRRMAKEADLVIMS